MDASDSPSWRRKADAAAPNEPSTCSLSAASSSARRRPFRGQSTHEILTAVLNGNYHLPGEMPEIRALDAVVQQCLARDRRDRYGSAAELKNALIPMLSPLRAVDMRGGPAPDMPTM